MGGIPPISNTLSKVLSGERRRPQPLLKFRSVLLVVVIGFFLPRLGAASATEQTIPIIHFSASELIDWFNTVSADRVGGPLYLTDGFKVSLAAIIQHRELKEGKLLVPRDALGIITVKGGRNVSPIGRHLDKHKANEHVLKSHPEIKYHIILDVGDNRDVWGAGRDAIGFVGIPAIFSAVLRETGEGMRPANKGIPSVHKPTVFSLVSVTCPSTVLKNPELFRYHFVTSAYELGFILVGEESPE